MRAAKIITIVSLCLSASLSSTTPSIASLCACTLYFGALDARTKIAMMWGFGLFVSTRRGGIRALITVPIYEPAHEGAVMGRGGESSGSLPKYEEVIRETAADRK